MSKIIPVSAFQTAGTCVLTHSVASNLVKSARVANDTAFSVWIPILLDSNGSALKGSRLKSIDVYYLVATADLTSFTEPVLQKITLPAADATAPTGAAVTTTSTPTNATTLTQAQHKATVTLTTPEWLDDDSYYILDLEIDPAAPSVITFYGARANFDLRV
jgi:hypothetical protein